MPKSSLFGAALALVLLASTAAAPGYAKDKAEAPKAEVISDKVRPFLAAAQAAMTKKDYPAVIEQVDKAQPLATSPFEKFLCGQFRAISGQAIKDNKAMLLGLDTAIDSGYKSPTVAQFAVMSGQIAYNAGDYARAVNRLLIAEQNNSAEPILPTLIADSYFKSKQVPAGLAYAEQNYAATVAAKKLPDQDLLARAAQAALTAKMPKETNVWMTRLVTNFPSSTNWHDMIAIYRDQHPTLSASGLLDMYRLMKASKSFKDAREVEEYAAVALDKKGLPGEAKAAMEDAAAAGMTLNKTMVEIKTVATNKAVADKASLPAAVRQSSAAPTGKIARGTAEAFFGYKDYAQAITLYKLAAAKGGVEPRLTNMGLGESYLLSGDKASARTAFAAVDGEGTDIAKMWLLWMDLNK